MIKIKSIVKFLAYILLYYVLSRINVLVHELTHVLVAYLAGSKVIKVHISLLPFTTSYVVVSEIPKGHYGTLFFTAGILANTIQLAIFSLLSAKIRSSLLKKIFLLESLALVLALSVYGCYMLVFSSGDLVVFKGYEVYCLFLILLPIIFETLLGDLWIENFGKYVPWNFLLIIAAFPPIVMDKDPLLEVLFSVLLFFHLLVPLMLRYGKVASKHSLFHYTLPPKLVRDKIPELCPDRCYRTAKDHEIKKFILKKIVEEALELYKSESPEEIADLLEIIEKCIETFQFDESMIEEIKNKKRLERGGFLKGYILER